MKYREAILTTAMVLLLSVAVAPSCGKPPSIQLTATGRGCLLEVRGTSLPLDLAGPCDFVRDHTGQPMTHSYGDVTVVVIVGGLEEGCGKVARAALLTSAKVELSARVASGGWKCPASGMDEKEFWLFAHGDYKRSAP